VTFDWDPRKAAANARKHGILFADAVLGEERWVTIGMDAVGRILVVVYAWLGDNIRIISARPATKRECRQDTENT